MSVNHPVDPATVDVSDQDAATWLLFFLESHGATVTLTDGDAVQVGFDSMAGLDDKTARRWAPVIVRLIPEMRNILRARARANETVQ